MRRRSFWRNGTIASVVALVVFILTMLVIDNAPSGSHKALSPTDAATSANAAEQARLVADEKDAQKALTLDTASPEALVAQCVALVI